MLDKHKLSYEDWKVRLPISNVITDNNNCPYKYNYNLCQHNVTGHCEKADCKLKVETQNVYKEGIKMSLRKRAESLKEQLDFILEDEHRDSIKENIAILEDCIAKIIKPPKIVNSAPKTTDNNWIDIKDSEIILRINDGGKIFGSPLAISFKVTHCKLVGDK
ncbi:MAG: hypothetical protein SV062_08180 [Thermodesulfobacteriota bacterium]|nr:hypothetical protein [Thermodesulfobacteriota bacterium]